MTDTVEQSVDVNWTGDKVITKPDGTVDFKLNVKLFDGRDYTLLPNVMSPYDVLSSTFGERDIHLRPLPQFLRRSMLAIRPCP